MAYQNIYYDRKNSIIHVWDDNKGYFKEHLKPYSFELDEGGDYKTIFGDPCKKVLGKSGQFENDVNPETRALIDLYLNDDSISENHRILFYDIEVSMKEGMPDPLLGNNPITSIAFRFRDKKWVYVLGSEFKSLKKFGASVVFFDNEKALLTAFITAFSKIRPTILVGWNSDFFDNPYVYHRAINILGKYKIKQLSPINVVYFDDYSQTVKIAGVSSFDYMQLYKRYTPNDRASYSLNYISEEELNRGKVKYLGTLDSLFKNDLETFIKYNLEDVDLIYDLDNKLKFIDLCRTICHMGHVPYEDYQKSTKILEGAILTYCRRKKLVCPNKPAKTDEHYQGAKVFKPIPTFAQWVFSVDLQSLYPSIMRTLGISPETKIGKILDWEALSYMAKVYENGDYQNISRDANNITIESISGQTQTVESKKFESWLDKNKPTIASNGVIYSTKKEGIIPEILTTWFNYRLELKSQMKKHEKNSPEYNLLDSRQWAIKILLNSMYGALGERGFRFRDYDSASAITSTGRDVIQYSAIVANKLIKNITNVDKNYVIYGDTDSCYITLDEYFNQDSIKNLPHDEKVNIALEISEKITKEINNQLQVFAENHLNTNTHYLLFKLEKICLSALFLKKKRYAVRVINDEGYSCDEIKETGLDTVRSDFPFKYRSILKTVIKKIMHLENEESVNNYIWESINEIDNIDEVIEIAKGSTLKKFNEYLPKCNFIGNFKKGLPNHYKAAYNTNELNKILDVSYEIPPFKEGDKIRVLYLKQNPYNIKEIGLNMEKNDKRLEEFVKAYIDRDKIWKSVMENKLQPFYSIMGWNLADKNYKVTKKLFQWE